ncbi:MAG: hypothetical protein ABSA10_05430 [Anaerolineales bacterium]|jgi:hypothetical protein
MQRINGLRNRIRRDPYEAAVIFLAAAVFIAIAVYAFGSDIRELAANRLQDDSYYYLQPAWNFSRSGIFTFDGEHPTYGFQPLWMIVLAVLARVSPDKLFFLRASVALGGLFFCLTGVALYRLARGWLTGWRVAIAPVLWTANHSLIAIYITGKENALFAFLLVVACILVCRRMSSPSRGAWKEGAVLGLMVLSRVNAVIPALLLLAVLWWQGAGSRAERARRAGMAALGMLAVVAVWCLYAQIAFGAVFPNSGTAKLFGSFAALAVLIERYVPWVPATWIERLVPGSERVLLSRPDLLTLPARGVGISYLFGLLPDLAYGAWAGIFSFFGALSFRLKVLLLAAVGIGSGIWVLIKLRGASAEPEAAARRGSAAVVGVILISAAVNSLGNWLLLPGYLLWGVWYTVAETLAMILALTCLLGEGLEYLAAVKTRLGGIWNKSTLLAGTLLSVVGLILFWAHWLPHEYIIAPDGTQQEAYAAADWMNNNLPQGARVGSFSAGLLGYFGRTYTVINLDGLANSPQFVNSELIGHLLYVSGVAPIDPLREYLRRENISYLANVDPLERITRKEYLGLVDAGQAVLLYEGNYAIFWGPAEPEQRMIVVGIGVP